MATERDNHGRWCAALANAALVGEPQAETVEVGSSDPASAALLVGATGVRRNGVLRKLFVQDDRIVGFRLTGDVSGAGIYRTLINKEVNVGPFKHRLLERGFGMGMIEERARTSLFMI